MAINDTTLSWSRREDAIAAEAAIDGFYVIRINPPTEACTTQQVVLANYLQWHMQRRLAPMLFDEHDTLARDAQRASPVAKAKPSPAASDKAASKQTDPAHGEPLPGHSFRTLLADLATLTRNRVRLGADRKDIVLAVPTKLPRRALKLPRFGGRLSAWVVTPS